MRVALIQPDTNRVREAYVADLRFVEFHQLIDSSDMVDLSVDQEASMSWVTALENSVTFDGFIASDTDFEVGEDAIPEGDMYGDPQLYPCMEALREQSDQLLTAFIKRQDKSEAIAEQAKANAKTEVVKAQASPATETSGIESQKASDAEAARTATKQSFFAKLWSSK